MKWIASMACLAVVAMALVSCDDGDGSDPATDGTPSTDGMVGGPDVGPGCAGDIDCLATEYCDRDAADPDSDMAPPPGVCRQGCRLDPPNCPPGRACHPDMRVCVGECICEAGAVEGCDGEALRVCTDDCFRYFARPCPEGQICQGGQCNDRPPPPDMGVPVDMAPPVPDMAPPAPDMAPPVPDMAPPEPDMAPPEPDMAPPPE